MLSCISSACCSTGESVPKKSSKSTGFIYTKLNSQLDHARLVCDFTGAVRPIFAIGEGKSYKLLSTGEKLGDVRTIYYSKADNIGKFCVYTPGDIQQPEKLEMKDSLGETQSFGSYNIPILELEDSPYKEKGAAKPEAKLVHAKDFAAIVRVMINSMSTEEDGAPKVYAFFSGKDHIIGSFELFHDGDSKFFTYAKVDAKKPFPAISYNYTDGEIGISESFGSKSHMYIRVINLAETPIFFKPKD